MNAQQDQHRGGAEIADDDHRRAAEAVGQRAAIQAAEDAAETVHGDDGAGHARADMHVGHQIHGEE